MRRRPNVAAEITAALAAQRIRSHVRADKVITELARVAFSDVLHLFTDDGERLRHPRHIPYDVRKAIASVRVSRERRTVTTKGKIRTIVTDNVIEYKFWNKNDALGRLMGHLGLTTEITPLESLLQALPRELAEQVRGALARQLTATAAVPSTNGKH
jgi:phage terminase small subunit